MHLERYTFVEALPERLTDGERYIFVEALPEMLTDDVPDTKQG